MKQSKAANRKRPVTRTVVPSTKTYVVSDYHAHGERPYRNVLRDAVTDAPHRDDDVIQAALEICGAVDGDEVVVTIVRTGRRPFGDRKVRLVRPHEYERDSVSAHPEESERAT